MSTKIKCCKKLDKRYTSTYCTMYYRMKEVQGDGNRGINISL